MQSLSMFQIGDQMCSRMLGLRDRRSVSDELVPRYWVLIVRDAKAHVETIMVSTLDMMQLPVALV